MIDTIYAWLAGLAGLEGLGLDALGPGEGAALFPQGERVVAWLPDILGGQKQRKRLELLLKLQRRRDPDGAETGGQALLERLAQGMASAPRLGEDQVARAENARQVALDHRGLAGYEMKLIFEFTE